MTPRAGWVSNGERLERADGPMLLVVTRRGGWWAVSVRLRNELTPFYADEFIGVVEAKDKADDAARRWARRHATNGVTDGV